VFLQQTYAPEEEKKGWYGKRVGLPPELIMLPRKAELRQFIADDQMDATNPAKKHFLLDY
jgi:hypothetical protein